MSTLRASKNSQSKSWSNNSSSSSISALTSLDRQLKSTPASVVNGSRNKSINFCGSCFGKSVVTIGEVMFQDRDHEVGVVLDLTSNIPGDVGNAGRVSLTEVLTGATRRAGFGEGLVDAVVQFVALHVANVGLPLVRDFNLDDCGGSGEQGRSEGGYLGMLGSR
ncbi:hypothetical protein P154DRAFT_589118 [Amniculicola lignicola CBS 123094]|uniref:Uncharacterized protein n=1 Tax=Amniculicola lignicola CBS 123094 TaxID=1392246 RepID=A0A6A5VX03_9PLEO|nr:hypothetical protein P154DRAFT_589118 [Amniculicola lignicola CBS 123094]